MQDKRRAERAYAGGLRKARTGTVGEREDMDGDRGYANA